MALVNGNEPLTPDFALEICPVLPPNARVLKYFPFGWWVSVCVCQGLVRKIQLMGVSGVVSRLGLGADGIIRSRGFFLDGEGYKFLGWLEARKQWLNLEAHRFRAAWTFINGAVKQGGCCERTFWLVSLVISLGFLLAGWQVRSALWRLLGFYQVVVF